MPSVYNISDEPRVVISGGMRETVKPGDGIYLSKSDMSLNIHSMVYFSQEAPVTEDVIEDSEEPIKLTEEQEAAAAKAEADAKLAAEEAAAKAAEEEAKAAAAKAEADAAEAKAAEEAAKKAEAAAAKATAKKDGDK